MVTAGQERASCPQLVADAKRIKARAIDRMGALLATVPPKGGQAAKGRGYEPPTPSRAEVARSAGLGALAGMVQRRGKRGAISFGAF